MITKNQELLDQRIIDLTPRQFMNALKSEGWRPPADTESPIKTPVTRKVRVRQLSEIYGWGESTIYKWCKAKKIPHFQVEAHEIWFDLEKIELWIEKYVVKTKDEIVSDWEAKKITGTRKTARS